MAGIKTPHFNTFSGGKMVSKVSRYLKARGRVIPALLGALVLAAALVACGSAAAPSSGAASSAQPAAAASTVSGAASSAQPAAAASTASGAANSAPPAAAAAPASGAAGDAMGSVSAAGSAASEPMRGGAADSNSGGETMAQPAAVDYAVLSGDIAIDGSSTVFPITEAVAEEFGYLTNGNVRVTVGVSGTGGGFKKFCNSETQISDASRPIKGTEVSLCAEGGVEYIEIPVAIDGLTVVANKENDFVECMTVAELNKMWAPEAEDTITAWNQVRADWPAEDMELYAPGVDSGTFDYFTDTVNGESGASRGDFTASEDDNVLVTGISGSRNGIGYFGYAYYVENAERLKAVAIDGGAGCVAPTDAAINDGSYFPLSRPLFIYVRKDAAQTPHIAEFIRYFLSGEGQQLAAEVGYIPFPPEVYALALAKFENGTTGAAFGGDNPMEGSVAEVLAASQ